MSKQRKPKAKKKPKPSRPKRHIRVTFFLVASTKEHLSALEEIRHYLEFQYRIHEEERELPVTGFTHSLFPTFWPHPSGEAVFAGYWWHTSEEEVQELTIERTALFLIDFPAIAQEWKIDEKIALLKTRIFEYYAIHQSPQEEIWIVKQDIYRYA